eukprot:g70433.t1
MPCTNKSCTGCGEGGCKCGPSCSCGEPRAKTACNNCSCGNCTCPAGQCKCSGNCVSGGCKCPSSQSQLPLYIGLGVAAAAVVVGIVLFRSKQK